MNDPFAAIRLDRPRVLHRQIRDRVRQLILSRKLGPGQRIPSTQELAAVFQADVSTVHDALSPLVKEGLLVRYPRKGTFVCQRDKRLTRVCIFLSQGPGSFSAFQQALYTEVLALLRQEKMEPDVWVDPRPEKWHGEPWAPLARAAEQRRVQAVIMIGASLPYLRWVSKLPVPTSFWTSASVPQAVQSDGRMFADLTLGAVKKRGCRSVGLITTAHPRSLDPYTKLHIHTAFFQYFAERAAALGVALRNDWMRLPSPSEATMRGGTPTESQQRYGYKQFQRLWKLRRRPEALIVAPDTVAAGVVAALLQQRVSVPSELKLILAKNARTDLFCPMPATFIITDERAHAQALLEQIKKQFRGEACKPITVGFTASEAAFDPGTSEPVHGAKGSERKQSRRGTGKP